MDRRENKPGHDEVGTFFSQVGPRDSAKKKSETRPHVTITLTGSGEPLPQ